MEFFATCNGIPIHISDSKKGDVTILLLHGYLETLYVWDDFIAKLLPKLRIISIDLPGHGLSGSHKTNNSIGFSAEVAKEVMDICKVEKACIIGHSMGGYIAIEAVKRYPERFSSLILMHSGPHADSEEKKVDRKREIVLINKSKLQAIAKMGIPKMFAQENLRRMDEKIHEIIELTDTHDPEGVVATLEGLMSREDNLVFLKKYSDPFLLILGKQDYHIPEEKANMLIAELPNAEKLILEHSGHNGFLEETEIVQKRVLEFLNLEI
ncbi:MAG: alpha/beta hydrolase [Bacteroidales bacterium]|jgi:pimeloyl-ACP methyl ester carboxylesterase